MNLYQKIMARIYFQYAVVWSKRTNIPGFYTNSLFSIVNFAQLCAFILLADLIFKTSAFQYIILYKWVAYLVSIGLFFYINNKLLEKIIKQKLQLDIYAQDTKARKKYLRFSMGYIIISIGLFFLLAKISYHVRTAGDS